MNQTNETDALLPVWLAEHVSSIEELSQSDTDLKELLDDHARLNKAIHYWNGKSKERVDEFRCMVKELQHEIVEMMVQKRYLVANECGMGRTNDRRVDNELLF